MVNRRIHDREILSFSTAKYWGLDRFGRVRTQYWRKGASTMVDKYIYTHDFASNRLSRENDGGYAFNLDQLYTYDGLNRLTDYEQGALSGGTISSPTLEAAWTLDALGNWTDLDRKSGGSYTLQQERSHNKVNEIDTDATHGDDDDSIKLQTSGAGYDWIDPVYDAAGNMQKGPRPGDERNANGGKGQKYTFDAWNRLVKVEQCTYSATDTHGSYVTLAEYEYDGLHRRIVRSIYVSGTLDHRMHDYYDGRQVVEVRKEVGGSEDPDPYAQYVYHPHYIDAVAKRWLDTDTDGDFDDQDQGAEIDGEHYYMHDANYNVTALLDAAGDPLERYHYDDPYGGRVTRGSGTWGTPQYNYLNPRLYTGRPLDFETGLYHNDFRYYHPTLGRFVNRDPIVYDAGDMNLYAYVGGRPTNGMDPSGLDVAIVVGGSVLAGSGTAGVGTVVTTAVPPVTIAVAYTVTLVGAYKLSEVTVAPVAGCVADDYFAWYYGYGPATAGTGAAAAGTLTACQLESLKREAEYVREDIARKEREIESKRNSDKNAEYTHTLDKSERYLQELIEELADFERRIRAAGG